MGRVHRVDLARPLPERIPELGRDANENEAVLQRHPRHGGNRALEILVLAWLEPLPREVLLSSPAPLLGGSSLMSATLRPARAGRERHLDEASIS